MAGNKAGFTLVELMVTLVLCVIVIAIMYSLYSVQNKSAIVQGQVAEMQQNIRGALDILGREIRMAGYDPEGSGNYGIEDATSERLKYTADICETGGNPTDQPDCIENYTVELYSKNNEASLLRRLGNETQDEPLAENVEQLEFCYKLKDADSCTTTSVNATERSNLESITVSLLVRASRADSQYQDTNTYTTISGADWTPSQNLEYRRRLVSRTIKLRNMGL